MKNISTEIIIEAPKAAVWETLMNFSAYPEWNPFIKQIKGEARIGNQLSVQIQPPGQKEMKFTPQILVCKKEEEFRWLGKVGIKGLFDGEHSFQLEAINPQQTRLTHAESFSGVLSGIIFRMISHNTVLGFEAMNEALKKRVEKDY